MSQQIKHIAVIRLSAMGDVAMTVPVINAFVKQHPDVRITMISRPFFEPMFSDIPSLEFFVFDANGQHKGFVGLIRFYLELKKYKIDAFADLHNVLRSKIIRTLLSFSATKTASLDKGKAEKQALTRPKNKVFCQLLPTAERYAQVFSKLGLPVTMSNSDFLPKRNMQDSVLQFTGEKKHQKWIGIAPFAKHKAKIYPQDLMLQVIDDLAKKGNYKLFLFGSGECEKSILKGFAGKKENTVIVAGKISFTEELQFISNLDIMLSMDSGNAHLAAMFGVHTITLWGATHPYAGFAPFGQPTENALVADRKQYPDLPTSIYGNKRVKGYEDVMRTIAPDSIVGHIETFLARQ